MVRVSHAAAAVVVLAALPAFAADLPPLPDLEPSTPIAVGGGWYLRGDAGLGSTSTSRARTPTVDLVPVDTALVRQRIENGWSIGGGVGYRFGSNFRADLTVGGLVGQSFRAVGIDAVDVGNPSSPAAYYRAGVSSTVALVNAYWDIATWQGITPFVGAGVGVAYNRLHDISRFDVGAPLGPATGYDAIARGSRTQAAFALYAGLAYEIMPGVTAEVAYRYLNLGSAGSNPGICGTGYLCTAATPLRVKSITSQDVMIGVRWDLSGV